MQNGWSYLSNFSRLLKKLKLLLPVCFFQGDYYLRNILLKFYLTLCFNRLSINLTTKINWIHFPFSVYIYYHLIWALLAFSLKQESLLKPIEITSEETWIFIIGNYKVFCSRATCCKCYYVDTHNKNLCRLSTKAF